MKLIITPGTPLRGSCRLPGDKSISHRAILLSAMAEGRSVIDHLLVSGVTKPLLTAIRACGVSWTLQDDRLTVESRGWRHWDPPLAPLHAGNSATTIRLLAGALAAAGIPAVLDGSPGLRRRPMDRLIEPLTLMGVPIKGAEDNGAPLTLAARPADSFLMNPRIRLKVASAQVKTALLLAGLAAEGPFEVSEPVLSRDHTERMLRGMGLQLETTLKPGGEAVHRFTPPSKALPPLRMVMPGDMSSAAFLMVAALITPGSEIVLTGVGLNPGRIGLLEALQEMGGAIAVQNVEEMGGEPVGDLVVRHSPLKGIRIGGERVVRMIDEFPVFAVAAAFASGRTEVREAAELRHKESDRIQMLKAEMDALGARLTPLEDGFIVEGGTALRGGNTTSHGDHRLAMSMAVAGLAAQRPVEVNGAEMINESFPGFESVLTALGARVAHL
ncbi:MAG: 3-phosphoshikimate 1-carboxyvinyltransferase [Kiritimatiellia bacterium]